MGGVSSEEVKLLLRRFHGGGTKFLCRSTGSIKTGKHRAMKLILGGMKLNALTLGHQ